MTIVGKILVFINLIFSLLVGVLVIVSYTARTHWADEYKKLSNRYQVALASNQAYEAEAKNVAVQADKQTDAIKTQLTKLQGDLEAQITVGKGLAEELQKQKRKNDQSDAVKTSSLRETELRQQDVEKLKDTLKKETDENTRLVKTSNELRDRAVSAEIQRKAVQDTNNRLEAQLQEMAREMARLKVNTSGTATARTGKNPPPENVEGLVKNADPGGLVTISIGSDAGLAKGNTMEVYRLSTIATQSKYLGTIRILEVTAHEAVAQPVGRLTAPLQKGDRVASRILGG
jgi:hypothetical protein